MEKQYITRLLSLIKLNYSYAFKDYSEEDLKILIEEWNYQFYENTYKEVYQALQNYISNEKYPPTISDIKEIIFNQKEKNDFLNSEMAWELVYKAGCDSIYSKEKYNNLPDYIKQTATKTLINQIALADQQTLTFLKKDYIAAYENFLIEQKRRIKARSIENAISTKENYLIENKGEKKQ